MRKSLIIYSLLLSFFLASSLRFAAGVTDAGTNTPSNTSVATLSEGIDDENGVSVDNLITIAPLFDIVPSNVSPVLKSAHWHLQRADRYDPPSLVTRNRTFRI